MAGSMTEIPVNGDAVPAYISLPPTGSGPAVVVIQEWWGLVPHIRNVADRLAAQGFVAVAPDLYRGKETTEPDEAGKLVMEMQLGQAAKDMAAAVDALLAMPETTGQGAGVIGFCVGGGLALFLASQKSEVRRSWLLRFPARAWRGPVGGQGGRASALREHDDFAPPRVVESASSASCATRGGRELPPTTWHQARRLSRHPAEVTTEARELSGGPRLPPTPLGKRPEPVVLGYAGPAKGSSQRGAGRPTTRRRTVGARPPGASPGRGDETSSRVASLRGPDRSRMGPLPR